MTTYPYALSLHLLAMALTVGALFVESLMIVMALKTPAGEGRQTLSSLLGRVHRFIYYPILTVTVLSGLYLAMIMKAFSNGGWLHMKLTLLVVLVGLGFLTGSAIKSLELPKGRALAQHIVIFFLSLAIIYIAAVKPF